MGQRVTPLWQRSGRSQSWQLMPPLLAGDKSAPVKLRFLGLLARLTGRIVVGAWSLWGGPSPAMGDVRVPSAPRSGPRRAPEHLGRLLSPGQGGVVATARGWVASKLVAVWGSGYLWMRVGLFSARGARLGKFAGGSSGGARRAGRLPPTLATRPGPTLRAVGGGLGGAGLPPLRLEEGQDALEAEAAQEALPQLGVMAGRVGHRLGWALMAKPAFVPKPWAGLGHNMKAWPLGVRHVACWPMMAVPVVGARARALSPSAGGVGGPAWRHVRSPGAGAAAEATSAALVRRFSTPGRPTRPGVYFSRLGACVDVALAVLAAADDEPGLAVPEAPADSQELDARRLAEAVLDASAPMPPAAAFSGLSAEVFIEALGERARAVGRGGRLNPPRPAGEANSAAGVPSPNDVAVVLSHERPARSVGVGRDLSWAELGWSGFWASQSDQGLVLAGPAEDVAEPMPIPDYAELGGLLADAAKVDLRLAPAGKKKKTKHPHLRQPAAAAPGPEGEDARAATDSRVSGAGEAGEDAGVPEVAVGSAGLQEAEPEGGDQDTADSAVPGADDDAGWGRTEVWVEDEEVGMGELAGWSAAEADEAADYARSVAGLVASGMALRADTARLFGEGADGSGLGHDDMPKGAAGNRLTPFAYLYQRLATVVTVDRLRLPPSVVKSLARTTGVMYSTRPRVVKFRERPARAARTFLAFSRLVGGTTLTDRCVGAYCGLVLGPSATQVLVSRDLYAAKALLERRRLGATVRAGRVGHIMRSDAPSFTLATHDQQWMTPDICWAAVLVLAAAAAGCALARLTAPRPTQAGARTYAELASLLAATACAHALTDEEGLVDFSDLSFANYLALAGCAFIVIFENLGRARAGAEAPLDRTVLLAASSLWSFVIWYSRAVVVIFATHYLVPMEADLVELVTARLQVAELWGPRSWGVAASASAALVLAHSARLAARAGRTKAAASASTTVAVLCGLLVLMVGLDMAMAGVSAQSPAPALMGSLSQNPSALAYAEHRSADVFDWSVSVSAPGHVGGGSVLCLYMAALVVAEAVQALVAWVAISASLLSADRMAQSPDLLLAYGVQAAESLGVAAVAAAVAPALGGLRPALSAGLVPA